MWERDPPYDIDFPGNRFKVSIARSAALRPRRRRHGQAVPETAAGDRRHRGGAVLARRGADGQARLPSAVGELPARQASQVALDQLRQGQGRGRSRRPTSPTGAWRAPSSSPTTTRWRARYGREDANSPYRFYFEQHARQDDSAATGSTCSRATRNSRTMRSRSTIVMQNCVFAGSVNKVVDQILKMREETGDFGELVYAGMDWVDPALAKRSMQLMAEQVMPRVNAAIGKQARGGVIPLRCRARCAARCRSARRSAARPMRCFARKILCGAFRPLRNSPGCTSGGRRSRSAPARRRPSR